MNISIHLNEDEALVLFEWLMNKNATDEDSLPVDHPAERLALWNLEAALEKTLVPILSPDYSELLSRARERLIEKGGMPE